jgi:hypothetical protein
MSNNKRNLKEKVAKAVADQENLCGCNCGKFLIGSSWEDFKTKNGVKECAGPAHKSSDRK